MDADADRGNPARTEEETVWADFEAELLKDDGDAAREHTMAGLPVYFLDDDTPVGTVIKQYPDGRRELVCFGVDGETVIEPAA